MFDLSVAWTCQIWGKYSQRGEWGLGMEQRFKPWLYTVYLWFTLTFCCSSYESIQHFLKYREHSDSPYCALLGWTELSMPVNNHQFRKWLRSAYCGFENKVKRIWTWFPLTWWVQNEFSLWKKNLNKWKLFEQNKYLVSSQLWTRNFPEQVVCFDKINYNQNEQNSYSAII